MAITIDLLFTEFAIGSFDKQLRLADVHGDDPWGFNMTAGEITFNDTHTYRVQILGTEDHVNETWMWGWANKASNIPEELLDVARRIYAYGKEQSITELTSPKLSMDDLHGHMVGLIACGLAKGRAYYRCPYENGALFVLITDEKLELPVENKIVRATRMIPECISTLEITDHRRATAKYLRQNGFDVESEGRQLVVREDGEPVLTAEFDELNRLTRLQSHVNPSNEA